ncbi:MAG TPA: metallophosphoesterase [Bacteroidales bacterium]|mgnify:FL=1|nr:metallophosphoesterase [Bacteroidales bacterium]HOK74938.1 metallophosphoesterase [Bacteroidales bacterium]HOU30132.1 metallophosphoesterase [Bacteroidales bacterium]HPP91904.1 metallophosphoesterase [Bacteroidales bacterium]HQG55377.1 metallophosphoesterase [Bacteroidales bacterium]
MRNKFCLKSAVNGIVTLILFFALSGCKGKSDSFSFVFMSDIHLTYERNAIPGFKKAIEEVNKLKPDFVITGGDLIMDALSQRYTMADSLYNLYSEMVKEIKAPVYNTMGNHELYGIYSRSGADPSNPEYGEKMFEKRLGKSYYSFDYKGWKFLVLNSVEDTGKDRYIGFIDSTQINWIKEELQKTDTLTPVVLVTHMPFITVNSQMYRYSTASNDSGLVVVNSREVLDLFSHYNLKLVLQGHLHMVEDIYIDGIRFITGGAVSANWWRGPYRGDEEGFILVNVKGDDFTWKFIDYGWEVQK